MGGPPSTRALEILKNSKRLCKEVRVGYLTGGGNVAVKFQETSVHNDERVKKFGAFTN